MKVTMISQSKDEASFLIEIKAEIFKKALMEQYQLAIAEDGKGVAPSILSDEAVLRNYPELEKISSQALEKLLLEYYPNALKELGIQPITFPEIRPKAMTVGQPCILEVRVMLEPEVELKQFEGLEVTYTPIIVSEKDIAQQMKGLRKQRGAENDDSKLLENMPFDSVEALTEDIRSSFALMAKEQIDFNKKEAVMEKLLAVNPISIREEVIEQQAMIEFDQIVNQMGQEGLQNYLKSSGKSMSDVKDEIRFQAQIRVKKTLLLAAVAEKISPEVTEEDLKEIITKQMGSIMNPNADYEAYRADIEKNPGMLDQLRHAVRLEKATDYLVSKAVFSEGEPKGIMD